MRLDTQHKRTTLSICSNLRSASFTCHLQCTFIHITVLGIYDILVRIRIELRTSLIFRMQGCRYYFSPLHTFEKKEGSGSTPPTNGPDPGGPKTCGSGSPSLILTINYNRKQHWFFPLCPVNRLASLFLINSSETPYSHNSFSIDCGLTVLWWVFKIHSHLTDNSDCVRGTVPTTGLSLFILTLLFPRSIFQPESKQNPKAFFTYSY